MSCHFLPVNPLDRFRFHFKSLLFNHYIIKHLLATLKIKFMPIFVTDYKNIGSKQKYQSSLTNRISPSAF